ncbi:MAG: ion transporter, partial [Bacteroidales bacterium]|nr:ion transporter [Bacteroidales bacterium]
MKDLKSKLYRIIFHVDTFWGKFFDVFLLILIFISVVLVALESVTSIKQNFGQLLFVSEWVITIIFTIEYILRIIVSWNTYKYVKSFWGIIDFISILPLYIAIFISGAHVLSVIRSLRLIRIFRVLNLSAFENDSKLLGKALRDSLRKIEVFLYIVLVMVIIIGTMMYYIEGAENGFTSIPKSVYWAIVSLTTVGYGDISPQTGIGQFLASAVMIIGYAIIAVPTGIVSAEMVNAKSDNTIPKCFKKSDFIFLKLVLKSIGITCPEIFREQLVKNNSRNYFNN